MSEKMNEKSKALLNLGTIIAQNAWDVGSQIGDKICPNDMPNVFISSILWSVTQLKHQFMQYEGASEEQAAAQTTRIAEAAVNGLIMSLQMNGFPIPQLPSKVDMKDVGIANNQGEPFGTA